MCAVNYRLAHFETCQSAKPIDSDDPVVQRDNS